MTTKLTALPGGKARTKSPATTATKPSAKRRMTLAQAIASGTELDKLIALRDLAAKRLADPKTPTRDFGTVMKQFRELDDQIAAAGKGGTPDPDGSASSDPASTADEPWDPEAI